MNPITDVKIADDAYGLRDSFATESSHLALYFLKL